MAELPEPGTLFANKYVIESQLGGGAAGVVLSAMHQELRQRVAIKVLRDAGPVSSERMMFEGPATLAASPDGTVWAAGGCFFQDIVTRWNGHVWQPVPHPSDITWEPGARNGVPPATSCLSKSPT